MLLMFEFVSRDATRDVCGGVELGQLAPLNRYFTQHVFPIQSYLHC